MTDPPLYQSIYPSVHAPIHVNLTIDTSGSLPAVPAARDAVSSRVIAHFVGVEAVAFVFAEITKPAVGADRNCCRNSY